MNLTTIIRHGRREMANGRAAPRVIDFTNAETDAEMPKPRRRVTSMPTIETAYVIEAKGLFQKPTIAERITGQPMTPEERAIGTIANLL